MDEYTQFDGDLLKDDSTSYSSSVATTISVGVAEESDDLHLGAEANSFSKRLVPKEENQPTEKIDKDQKSRCKFGDLIVMKQIYCSLDNSDTDVTYAAVSSVTDLLEARECDADEVLTNLGFANCADQVAKKDILSRFKASPLLNNEDNRFLDAISNNQEEHWCGVRPQLNESIYKAEEWLALHHSEEDVKEKNDPSKFTGTGHSYGKKASLSRPAKWRRFSKSRQSSFELLLPNLKEEETNQEAEPSSKEKSQAGSAAHPPIRESSLELPSSTDTKLEHNKEVATLTRSSPVIEVDANLKSEQTFAVTQNDVTYMNSAAANEDDLRLSRRLKTSLLIAHQRDSFEFCISNF